jgi:hypothetical protein
MKEQQQRMESHGEPAAKDEEQLQMIERQLRGMREKV